MSTLIFGCGYLGSRVARHWIEQGRSVWALTRGRGVELASLGITPIIGDVLEPASLSALPSVDTVLYAIARDRASSQSMHEIYVAGLTNVLNFLPPPKRFVYISSTSVYGQTDGEEVNEMSPTDPTDPSGQTVLTAEQVVRRHRPETVILRLAGIYGPGRALRRAAIARGEVLAIDPDKWLNLIHVDDGVQAVLAAETQGHAGETYNVSDNTPVRRRAYYSALARLLNAPEPRFAPPTADDRSHRRISNRIMRDFLGVNPMYPSYVEGLPTCL